MTGPRVVSLVPSATETLLALGADVAACTRFCNQPGIPTVGGTKNPDLEAIGRLAPDVVVVDTEENRREDAVSLERAGLELLVLSVRSIDDAAIAVRRLADVAGASPPDLETATIGPSQRRSAFVPIWRRPWMTISARTYGASLLASIGVDVVDVATGADPGHYPTVELDAVAALDPDLVLVPSEPYAFTDDHVDDLHTAFAGVAVVRVDGEDLFWWGIRTPAAQRRLASQLAR